jgi:hypothetical protein
MSRHVSSPSYRPSRIPLAVHRLPGVAGYTASLFRRFLDGTRRVSPVAWHDLVTVLSRPTPPKCFAASVLATLHAAFAREVRARPSGFSTFEALWVYLRYGPVTRSPSLLDGFVNRLQDLSFLPSCYSSYGARTLTPMGLSPTVHASLRRTHTYRYRSAHPDLDYFRVADHSPGAPSALGQRNKTHRLAY